MDSLRFGPGLLALALALLPLGARAGVTVAAGAAGRPYRTPPSAGGSSGDVLLAGPAAQLAFSRRTTKLEVGLRASLFHFLQLSRQELNLGPFFRVRLGGELAALRPFGGCSASAVASNVCQGDFCGTYGASAGTELGLDWTTDAAAGSLWVDVQARFLSSPVISPQPSVWLGLRF